MENIFIYKGLLIDIDFFYSIKLTLVMVVFSCSCFVSQY